MSNTNQLDIDTLISRWHTGEVSKIGFYSDLVPLLSYENVDTIMAKIPDALKPKVEQWGLDACEAYLEGERLLNQTAEESSMMAFCDWLFRRGLLKQRPHLEK